MEYVCVRHILKNEQCGKTIILNTSEILIKSKSLNGLLKKVMTERLHDVNKYNGNKSPFGSGINFRIEYKIVLYNCGDEINEMVLINDRYEYDVSYDFDIDYFVLITKCAYGIKQLREKVQNAFNPTINDEI